MPHRIYRRAQTRGARSLAPVLVDLAPRKRARNAHATRMTMLGSCADGARNLFYAGRRQQRVASRVDRHFVWRRERSCIRCVGLVRERLSRRSAGEGAVHALLLCSVYLRVELHGEVKVLVGMRYSTHLRLGERRARVPRLEVEPARARERRGSVRAQAGGSAARAEKMAARCQARATRAALAPSSPTAYPHATW